MKKFFTLFLIALTALTLKSTAQLPCQAHASFNHEAAINSWNLVHFINTSTVSAGTIASSHWSFGDGSTSGDFSPSHLYANAGTYNVCLKITGSGGCVDSVCSSVIVSSPTTPPCTLHADYISQPSLGATLSMYFTNTSTPVTDVHSSHWSFGDGSSANTPNAYHTYSTAGTYTVCLKVKRDSLCSDSICKNIVVVGLTPPPCNLHAGFIHQLAVGSSNLIYFTNTSTPILDIHESHWTFGDGTSANTTNAFHTYINAGTYTVCLKVRRDSACYDSTCQTVVVTLPNSCNLHAKFSYHRDSIQTNKVYFTNLSTPVSDITSTKWIFGDGTFSYDFNAIHTYALSGLYHVCLIVRRDSSCQRDTCMNIQIQVPPPPPSCNLVANFVWAPDSIQVNKIHFTNLSVPLSSSDSIRWTFGDGTTSFEVSPNHVYTTPGTYTACLRVKKNNSNGGTSFCVKEICKVVIVQAACVLHAEFSSHSDSLNRLKVYFSNQSTPASSVTYVQWTFGDGSSSSSWSPDHVYAQAGTYNVCLHISSGAGCYSSICKQVVVVEPVSCLDISKFDYIHSTGNCLEYQFQPLHLNPSWQYHWTFGDGTASSSVSPSHVYAQPGNYIVCLTTIRSNTCASTTCKPLSTGLCFSCNNVWVKYTYTRDPSMPNKLHFHGLSNYSITAETWTFTKLSPGSTPPVVLHQFDPTYVFPEPGYYRVCLNAVTYGGCIKEYCEVIYIGQIGGVCTLQAFPNPAHATVSVNVTETAPEVIHVYIYNSLNILVKQQDQAGSIGNNLVTVNIETLLPGPYTMRIVYGNHVCYAPFQKI